jgi:hypothetical protein
MVAAAMAVIVVNYAVAVDVIVTILSSAMMAAA